MVNRFLGWKLPQNFNPDGGISFKREYNEDTPWPGKYEPYGTNLFDATQARAMFEYCLDFSVNEKMLGLGHDLYVDRRDDNSWIVCVGKTYKDLEEAQRACSLLKEATTTFLQELTDAEIQEAILDSNEAYLNLV
jgi:hypothetical protein